MNKSMVTIKDKDKHYENEWGYRGGKEEENA